MWKFPHYNINEPLDLEELSQHYTWIEDMKFVPQDKLWHGEGNVFIHTQMVINALLKLPEFQALNEQDKHILVTAALFHDVEKRSTTMEEEIDGQMRIVSPRHAKKGEFTAREILYKEMSCPFHIREQICKLVRLHGVPLWAIMRENPQKEVVYASTVLNTQHLAMLAKADVLGRICLDEEDLFFKLNLFQELCKENNCWGRPKDFASTYGRYLYFEKKESYPNYEPYDDLICTVTVMCALPGSGKDTYIKNQLKQPVLSLDNIRREHKIAPTDKKGNGRVIQMAKEKAKEFLRSKTSFVFNATNITADMRSRWIGLFVDYKARVKIIYIEVPYRTLLKQNANRDHKVPVNVIENMISKLEIPTVKEAHEITYYIRE